MSKVKKILISGSAGLIGSEAVRFFAKKGFEIHGIDNDMRKYFFGKEASTAWARNSLLKNFKDQYFHHNCDIRDINILQKIFKKNRFDLIIHAAAQPSHDWAAKEPFTDFGINAYGTLNLLENTRKYSPNSVFIFLSTNKVYGDNPNRLPLKEMKTRYELPKKHKYYKGINESMSIDQTTHSLFGASKVAADILVQEYGNYFGIKTGIFRAGCLTGPAHSGAVLHGFLAYLIKCIAIGREYVIFGYKGKQVRDNIHSYDLVNALYHFYKKPKRGAVYNIGGGRHSNISMLEAVSSVERELNKKAKIKYLTKNRVGDHIWYISDMAKFRSDYPQWDYTYTIADIIKEMCQSPQVV